MYINFAPDILLPFLLRQKGSTTTRKYSLSGRFVQVQRNVHLVKFTRLRGQSFGGKLNID